MESGVKYRIERETKERVQMGLKDVLNKNGIETNDYKISVVESKDLKVDRKKPTIFIRSGTKEVAIKIGLIPEKYIELEFDVEKIKEDIAEIRRISARKFNVVNFEGYIKAMEGVEATLIANKLPEKSMLFGAPSGFGQLEFATSCILKLYEQNRKCTPLVSLTELAQIKLHNEERLLKGINSYQFYKGNARDFYIGNSEYAEKVYKETDGQYEKRPLEIIDRYSWSEYMNCDMLFCYFTDVSSKQIESEMYKAVLNIRGKKGLPTIAFIFSSLNPYKGDKELYEYVWGDILTYRDTINDYGRIEYINCYKNYNLSIKEY